VTGRAAEPDGDESGGRGVGLREGSGAGESDGTGNGDDDGLGDDGTGNGKDDGLGDDGTGDGDGAGRREATARVAKAVAGSRFRLPR
jgi:hypothetical protein